MRGQTQCAGGRTRDRRRRRRGVSLTAPLGLLVAALTATSAAAAVTPDLERELRQARPDARLSVVALLRTAGPAPRRPARRAEALRRAGARAQARVLERTGLRGVRPYPLVNALSARLTPDRVRRLAADPEVARVDLDGPIRLHGHSKRPAMAPFPRAGEGSWGVRAVRAVAVWRRQRVTGAAATIGVIDTGVNPRNPSLRGKIAGFRDFVRGRARPYDDNGHGTGVAGAAAGRRSGGAPIGVAPGSRVLVAKAVDARGHGARSALLAAAEWLCDPDGDPSTDDAPAVVVNAWGGRNPNDPWFRRIAMRWRELGILPVFAAGNRGPARATVGSPAAYPEVLAVGATDRHHRVARFSARGPVTWRDQDGLGPPAGTRLAKPDLVAPGVGVVTTAGRGYLAWSGTSVAAAHVAGVAALVRAANPRLGVEDVAAILRATARDLAPAGVDARSGAGLVNALAAVRAARGG